MRIKAATVKKLATIILAVTLVFSLTACSGISNLLAKIGIGSGSGATAVTPGDGDGTSQIGIAPTAITVSCAAFDEGGVIRLAPSGESATTTVLVEVTPQNATNKSMTFTSSKSSVFTCEKTSATSCTLTATAASLATATLTVAAEADASVKKEIVVKVEEVHLSSIGLPGEDGTYGVGKTFTLYPKFVPVNAMDKSVTFASSDQTVATITSGGVVTTLAEGTSTITITSNANSAISVSYVLTVIDYSTALLPQSVQVDGTKIGDDYLPVVYWNEMAGGGAVTIEIKKGATAVNFVPTNEHYDNFGHGYCVLPAAKALLTEEFSVRMKYTSAGVWTESVLHRAYADADLTYFEPLASGTRVNRYFNSLSDMNETMVYLCTFRPEGFGTDAVDGSGNTYDFELDTITGYTAADIGYSEGDEEEIRRLLTEVTSLSAGGLGASIAYGGVAGKSSLKLRIVSDQNPTMEFTAPASSANKAEFADNAVCPHTGEGAPRPATYDEFATESNLRTELSVTTSEQLLWAVEHGYKPVPVADSAAETVYDAAKTVLRNNILYELPAKEKIHIIYDWLSVNVTYDKDLLNAVLSNPNGDFIGYNDFYLEGVFLSTPHIAVCDGISKAFSLLAAMEGVDVVRVSGYVNTGDDNVAHAWNKIRINSCWYNVDATWASKSLKLTRDNGATVLLDNEFLTHAYLFCSDADLSTHVEAEKFNYPDARDSINPLAGTGRFLGTEEAFEAFVSDTMKTEYNNSRPVGNPAAKRYVSVEVCIPDSTGAEVRSKLSWCVSAQEMSNSIGTNHTDWVIYAGRDLYILIMIENS